MEDNQAPARPPKRLLTHRLLSGFAIALTVALSAYLLFSLTKAGNGWFASLWFLALLPAVLCALICYMGDPDGDRSAAFYWLTPIVLVSLVVVGSIFILREGVICLVMVSPIWVASGWAGAFLVRARRGGRGGGSTLQSSFVIIPLVAGLVEAQIPPAHDEVLVSRRVVVNAAPEEIWPFAVSNPAIAGTEGRWTITQSLLGVPRPRATTMNGKGIGAVRTAYWGDNINFEERITDWLPGERLAWQFSFTNSSVQDFTDKHIAPDGVFLKVDSGDYALRRLAPGVTELTLTTRYVAKTHVNPYAALWGELLLGDTEANILTIIKDRAEAAHAKPAPAPLYRRPLATAQVRRSRRSSSPTGLGDR